jgi:hypothetical protein
VPDHFAVRWQWSGTLRLFRADETADVLCREFTGFTENDDLLAPLGHDDGGAPRRVPDQLLATGVLIVNHSPGCSRMRSTAVVTAIGPLRVERNSATR